MMLFGLAREPATAFAASIIACDTAGRTGCAPTVNADNNDTAGVFTER